jgi:hypothetical protein
LSLYAKEPDWRYRVTLAAGGELLVDPRDCKRVIDKRTPRSPAVTVWEVRVNGVIRRLWPEDIARIDQEAAVREPRELKRSEA